MLLSLGDKSPGFLLHHLSNVYPAHFFILAGSAFQGLISNTSLLDPMATESQVYHIPRTQVGACT